MSLSDESRDGTAICGPGSDHGEANAHLSHMTDRDGLLRRLKRIEGQARGLHRMVDEDRYCVDILIQVAAVKAALDAVALSLMDGHIRGCVRDAIVGGWGDQTVEELVDVLGRFIRQA